LVLSICPRTRSLPGPTTVRITSSPECTVRVDHRWQLAEAQYGTQRSMYRRER
jgi:hypothetical protein